MNRRNIILANARKLIPVTHDGVIDLDWLTVELADTRPGLIGVMAANNETGVIQPWREILSICQSYEVPFFTDAVQWLGKMPAKDLGQCDFVCGAAHKFGGPRGVGFLKIPHRSKITPLLARRQTGARHPRRNGKCRHDFVHVRRAGSPRKADRSRPAYFARRLARKFREAAFAGIAGRDHRRREVVPRCGTRFPH